MWAIVKENAEVAKLLLDNGADPNIKSNNVSLQYSGAHHHAVCQRVHGMLRKRLYKDTSTHCKFAMPGLPANCCGTIFIYAGRASL